MTLENSLECCDLRSDSCNHMPKCKHIISAALRDAQARIKELESLLSGRTMSCDKCNKAESKLLVAREALKKIHYAWYESPSMDILSLIKMVEDAFASLGDKA